MKWLLTFLCFTTITTFSQTKEPLLEKLKKTQGKLHGKVIAPGQEITPKSMPDQPSTYSYKKSQKPPIINPEQQTALIVLKQDQMPCLVPNMQFWKAMPNAGNKVLLEKPLDPGIYLYKPKS